MASHTALKPTVLSPWKHTTDRSTERSHSFCPIFSILLHFQRLEKQLGSATPDWGGQNSSPLLAAERSPTVAPIVLHGLKVMNQSRVICMRTSLPFVFQRGTHITAWTRKPRWYLNYFQENDSIGREYW